MSFMYVKIHYGPYLEYETYAHRPQKLAGIRNYLLKYGYRVVLKPTDFIDKCMFEICGHEIFACNIRNFKFNMPIERDPVAQRAFEAILDSTEKFARTRTYLWLWALIEDQIFQRNKYTPTDHWIEQVEFVPFHKPCSDCCHILVGEKEQEPKQYQFAEQDLGSDKVMFPFDADF